LIIMFLIFISFQVTRQHYSCFQLFFCRATWFNELSIYIFQIHSMWQVFGTFTGKLVRGF
jgi:hypothetical protein